MKKKINIGLILLVVCICITISLFIFAEGREKGKTNKTLEVTIADAGKLSVGEGKKNVAKISKRVNVVNVIQLPIADASEPEWSPDGNWIVFTKCPVPSISPGEEWTYTGIYKTDVNGTNTVVLYQQNGQIAETPQWSPDGTKIAFHLIKEDTSYGDGEVTIHDRGDIWVMNSDGSGLRQLTTSADTTCIDTFSWLPDGLKIIYQAFIDKPIPRYEALFSISITGREPQRIFTEKDVEVEGKIWTPFAGFDIKRDNKVNGEYKIWAMLLIPSATPEKGLWEDYYELWTMDLDGKNPVSKMDLELAGSYSPDMSKVVGIIDSKICFANIDGNDLQETEYNGTHIRWSPVENKIVYEWFDQEGNHLCIMTVEVEE
ncbi:MAG: hypothetical protein AB1414_16420 [bacterium]